MKHQSAMLILFLIAVGSLTGIPSGSSATTDLQITNGSGSGFGDLKEDGLVGTLILFLGEAGLDLSYGENNETIFTMVDTSLTTIISDLSSGNTEGFTNIPLINETLAYLDITPADIVVNPEDVEGTMPAIDTYNSRSDGSNAHF
ncbi:hypothetical protein [uncultured Methanospirillum sp.]|uniref:hypothetical protein n=1 Tax=uncultured Methanospirillum sp. TaxID=262503 RepID=UPI0029C8E4F0|nr:hypothetical protein [uncultured Methanospirillum sp.]